MTNRTLLLVVVAGLSVLGAAPGMLRAQPPTPQSTAAQQQQIQKQIEEATRALQQPTPPSPPGYPTIPPNYSQDRQPALLRFVKDNEPLGGLLVAVAAGLVIALFIGVVLGVCRMVGELLRLLCSPSKRDSGDGRRAPPSGEV